MLAFLIVTHVVLTTTGYLGLTADSLWLFLLCLSPAGVEAEAIHTWRRLARIFGPLLGVGTLMGFWLAAMAGISLASPWLVATYAVVVLALGAQALIMIPWQVRADGILSQGGKVRTLPVIIVLVVLFVTYTAILSLMLLKPTWY